MADLEPILAYFRLLLANVPERTHDTIRSTVASGPFRLAPEDAEAIIRHLEASFDITQQRGATVKADFKPWLSAHRRDLDFFYWGRLRRYLLEADVLPPKVISTLDDVTDEILDYTGCPLDSESWRRRGMVIGHVQSGKTTNYASLICKAADAGYKIIILLAGITNALRQQTQERLDEYFIGKKSVFLAVAQEQLTIVNYATQKRFPAYGTSRDRDFSKVGATTWGVTLSALNEPIIFITKKHKSTLENLADWLAQQQGSGPIREPLLLIDDEADNASINTSSRPDRVTAINEAIRRILSRFERSTYVGYTATPFANIFIDPDSEDDMLKDDLFPRHFIKALDPPSNYMGARRFFGDAADPGSLTVQVVADFNDVLPLNHKKDARPEVLPASLKRAINVFVLARAVRVLRGDGRLHCSMMINVSRFNDVQEHISGLVYRYLQELKDSIAVNSGLGLHATDDPCVSTLEHDFNDQYSSTGLRFDAILAALSESVGSIRVVVVNMRGGSLDYRKHVEQGLHVIAIGGLALSRGLTLEGLLSSYILRNVDASDTLMQMARWFGYRPRYEDLCRLYLPQESLNHYEYITEAIEELRSEVKQMDALGLTPETFGLKVRQSPAAIRITAANKMRSASAVVLAQNYAGHMIEGYALRHNRDVNSQNREHLDRFLSRIGQPDDPHAGTLYWTDVSGLSVTGLLDDFVFSDSHPELAPIQGRRSLFADYVHDRSDTELARWDVAVPAYIANGSRGEPVSIIAGHERQLVKRSACKVLPNDVLKLTGKNKAANPGDEKIGLTEAAMTRAEQSGEKGARKYCRERSRPLLLVHIVTASGAPELAIDSPVVSLSFCMPDTSMPALTRTYQVNVRYRQLLLADTTETEDDEELLDETTNA